MSKGVNRSIGTVVGALLAAGFGAGIMYLFKEEETTKDENEPYGLIISAALSIVAATCFQEYLTRSPLASV